MMAGMITLILTGLLRGVRTRRALVLENLALRHQLAVQLPQVPAGENRAAARFTNLYARHIRASRLRSMLETRRPPETMLERLRNTHARRSES